MKITNPSFRVAAVLVAGALAAACSPSSSSTTPSVSSVTVALHDTTIPAGITTTVTATAKLSNGTTKDVTTLSSWKTSSQATAIVACTVSPCPVTTIAAGTATLTATYGGKGATADLTVTDASLKSITVTPARTSIAKGATTLLSAHGVFSDASAIDITSQVAWSSGTMSVLTIAGSLATGVGAGTSTVSAALNGVTGTVDITVTDAQPLSMALSPSPLTLPVGATQQLAAQVTFTDSSTADVASTAQWTSSNNAVAVVSTSGVVHALTTGSATISAASGTLTASEVVNVGAPAIVSISIAPTPVALSIGGTQQLTVTAQLTDSNTSDVTSTTTWTTSDATVATISTTGLISAVANGAVTITATVGDATATVPVTVTMAAVDTIEVTPATFDLPLGTTKPFAATAHLVGGGTVDITSTATWTSGDPSVAPVSAAGVVTASARTSAAVTITATLGDASGTASITVSDPVLASIVVTAAASSVVAGFTDQLTASGTLTDGSPLDVTTTATWTTSNSSLATVDAAGLVTTASNGSVTLTATQANVQGSFTLTVQAATISSIVVEPATVALALGQTKQLKVTATLSNGATSDVTSLVSWASTDTTNSIARVSSIGLVTTVVDSATSVTFTATINGKSAQTVVTVGPPVLDSIAVSPNSVALALGQTKQLTVTGHLTNGDTEDDTTSATWTSDDATGAIATISASGLISTVSTSATPVIFTATVGTFTSTSRVVVNAAAPVSINVTPSTWSLAAGQQKQLAATAVLTDGNFSDVTSQVIWTTDNAAIATVNGGLVTAVAQNATDANITAKLGSFTSSAAITVTAPIVTSVAITPSPLALPAGRTQQLVAQATLSNHTNSTVTSTATWVSDNAGVATISSSGLLTAVAAGTVLIHATSGSITGDLSVTVNAPVVEGVVASPNPVSLAVGQTQQLVLTATLSDTSTEDRAATASWASSDTSIATVSATGLVTATGASATGAVITGTLGSFSSSTTVTVTAAVVSSVTVDTASVIAGRTTQLTATAHLSDGGTADITATATWSSNSAHATVSATGLVTGVTQGSATITAQDVGGLSGSNTATVLAPVVDSVTVTAVQTSIPAGATTQLVATGHLSDGTTTDITNTAGWTVDDVSLGAVDAAGLFTGTTPGSIVVTATSGSASNTVTLTVVSGVQSLTLTPGGHITLPQGVSLPVTVWATLTDASTLDVTAITNWTADETPSGTLTIDGSTFTGAAPGTATAHATVGSVTVDATVTVTLGLTGVAVTPVAPKIPGGLSLSAHAVATLTDSSTVDLSSIATWSSADASKVSVSTDGVLTAIAEDYSTVVITATVGSFSGTTSVKAVPFVNSIAVTPGSVSLPAGLTSQLTVTATLDDSTTLNVDAFTSWSTDAADGSVATITPTGNVKGVSESATPVTFTATVSGHTSASVVTVIAPEITALHSAASFSLTAGLTHQLTVMADYTDDSTGAVTAQVTWTTDDATGAFATVSASGLVTGIATGSVVVTGTIGTKTVIITATITDALLTGLSLSPADAHVSVPFSEQLAADGTFTDGSHHDQTANVAWDTSDALTATVVGGEVSCVAGGTATITATIADPQSTSGGLLTAHTTVVCDL